MSDSHELTTSTTHSFSNIHSRTKSVSKTFSEKGRQKVFFGFWEVTGNYTNETEFVDDRNNKCMQNVNGTLATIMSPQEQFYASGVLNSTSKFMTAGNRLLDGTNFRWMYGPYARLIIFTNKTLATGTCVTYCPWNSGEPNNFRDENEDLLSLQISGWNDNVPDRQNGYVCEKYVDHFNHHTFTLSTSHLTPTLSMIPRSSSPTPSLTLSSSPRSFSGEVSVTRSANSLSWSHSFSQTVSRTRLYPSDTKLTTALSSTFLPSGWTRSQTTTNSPDYPPCPRNTSKVDGNVSVLVNGSQSLIPDALVQEVPVSAAAGGGVEGPQLLFLWNLPPLQQVDALGQGLAVYTLVLLPPVRVNTTSSSVLTSLAGQSGSPFPFSIASPNSSTLIFTLTVNKTSIGDGSRRASSSRIVVPSLSCPGLFVGIVVTVSGASASTQTTSQKAAATATSVGTVVAAASFSPTAAAQMARLGAMQSISACVFTNDDVPISFSGGSYTSLVVGSTPGMYLRGAVLGNALVVAAGTCILGAVVAAWTLRERFKLRIAANQSALHERVAGTIARGFELGRVPSVYYPVYAVFAPPTVGFAITLFSISPLSSENLLIATATCLIAIAYAIFVSRNLFNHRQALELGSVKWPSRIVNRHNLLMALCHPKQRWCMREAVDDPWRRRNRLLFDDFDRWWYGLIDLWSSLVVGIVNGIQVSSREVCAAQIAVMLLIFLVVFGLGIYFNPCMSRSLRFYVNTSNAIGLASCCALVTAIRTDSELLLSISNWLMLALSSISILKLMVDVIYVLYRFVRSFDVMPSTSDHVGVHGDSLLLPVRCDDADGTSDPIPRQETADDAALLEMVLLGQQGEESNGETVPSPVGPHAALQELDDKSDGSGEVVKTGTDEDFCHTMLGEIHLVLKPTDQARRTKAGDYDVFGLAQENDIDFLLTGSADNTNRLSTIPSVLFDYSTFEL